MVHNVNCNKKSQMVKPNELVKLPQDKIKYEKKPKSTKEEFEKFTQLVNNTLNKN